MSLKTGILIFLLVSISFISFAQTKDSVKNISAAQTTSDSIIKPKHDPHIATRRSLIIPGWGQAYNHEYWKIPLVYGVIAIPTATFIFNRKWYRITKDAYNLLYAATYGSNLLVGPTAADTLNLDKINSAIRDRVKAGLLDLATLQTARNAYRKNRDYSIFYFLIAWGLNVADATVFGNLKDFDVSNNLSMRIQPTFNPEIKSPGISLVFNFKTPKKEIKSFKNF